MKNVKIFKSPKGRQEIMELYDSILERWPVDYEMLDIPTRHGKTSVIACGSENLPAMILIHGSTSNATMWIGDVAEYSKNYRVYAVDIPGEPGKSEAVRLDMDSPAFIEWLEDLVTSLQIKSFSLIGMSLGGWIALKFAISKSKMVEKLVLICPSGIEAARKSFGLRALFCLIQGERGIHKLNKIVYGNQPVPKEVIEVSTILTRNFNPRMDTPPVFSDQNIRQLTMPVLYIAGKLDALLQSEKSAKRLKSLLPNAQINIIPNAGHALIDIRDKIIPFLLNS